MELNKFIGMNRVDSYSFGKITINSQTYKKDVIITPENILEDNWWREEGHELNVKDLGKVIEYNPDIFVMGIGNSGRVDIQPEAENKLSLKNIKLKAAKTKQATQIYNNLVGSNTQRKICGGFHLTC